MPQLELYEKKVLRDEELPIQLSSNVCSQPRELFPSHWHEHLELHYIVEGEADMYLNQTLHRVRAGDLLIANTNELHSGFARVTPHLSRVIIFDLRDLSPELAKENYIFQPIIHGDEIIRGLVERIFQEKKAGLCGHKPLCRALVMELLVYLCRTYVHEALPEKDSQRRKKNLERLNTVLAYIEKHYPERMTNAQLAEMACLSADRFEHLFREEVGMPPLKYINEMRVSKALNLLQSTDDSVTEIAKAVGLDYNHFGRLFRRLYGCTPREVRAGRKVLAELVK